MHLSMVRRAAAVVLVPLAVAIGATACQPTSGPATVPYVDPARYAGTWYEIASVKQFFSIGLVGTTATYTVRPDGSIKVVNAGRYLTKDGLTSSITGSAVPVDATNSRLNVSFAGTPSSSGAGNYWIVDLDPAYQWAIVSDPTGKSCYLLTRTKSVPDDVRAELLARAKAKGVDTTNVTPTSQP
ncbi:MAG: lipocalin family protein [Acidimicrobiales bacterium]